MSDKHFQFDFSQFMSDQYRISIDNVNTMPQYQYNATRKSDENKDKYLLED